MLDNQVIYIRIHGIPVISICTNSKIISSLFCSIDLIKSQIPGLSIVRHLPNSDVFWKINFIDSDSTILEIFEADGTIVLKGKKELLTPSDWSNLILSLSSKSLQYSGLYQIDASGILFKDEIILFSAKHDAGKSALAFFLNKLGYPVISTQTSLIDESMHFQAGTRHFRIQNYYIRKYFPELLKGQISLKPFEQTLIGQKYVRYNISVNLVKPARINRVYHLHLQNTEGNCKEVVKYKDRLLFASNVLSRHICCHTVVGSWGLILPLTDDENSLKCRSKAILAMAELKQYNLYCQLQQLEKLIFEHTNGHS